ncbi:MAG: 5-formyltetrahydrofolate cyclo-ligase [Klebsiella michiganensis]|nr:5-formyltetrahydrofolate cyclo-ligase [Klebsiella michiganensis]
MTLLSDIPFTRQQIRQQIRQRRRALTPEQQTQFALHAADRMMAYPPVLLAQTVAVFLSFDGELDTRPLIDQLWRAGKRVYLPVLHPFSPGNLLFLHYHPSSDLVVNRLNIREPKLDVRDVLDRTLQNWRQHRLQPVGYAHDCQQVDALPTEQWDIPLPAVITPSKTWLW